MEINTNIAFLKQSEFWNLQSICHSRVFHSMTEDVSHAFNEILYDTMIHKSLRLRRNRMSSPSFIDHTP